MGEALSSYLHLSEPGLTDTPSPSGKADPTEHTWQAAPAPCSPFPQRAGAPVRNWSPCSLTYAKQVNSFL